MNQANTPVNTPVNTQEYQECPICTNDVININKTVCCRQIIHAECLQKCLLLKNECPFCRSLVIEIPENSLTPKNPINFCAITNSIICCLILSLVLLYPLGSVIYYTYNTINN